MEWYGSRMANLENRRLGGLGNSSALATFGEPQIPRYLRSDREKSTAKEKEKPMRIRKVSYEIGYPDRPRATNTTVVTPCAMPQARPESDVRGSR